jgi:hypothetical protein
LARRILRPTEENADVAAKREAVLRPRIFGEFLHNYDGHPFPRTDIAANVLEGMGVPRDKTAEVLERIEASARSVGFLEQIKDKIYVSLRGVEGGSTPVEELKSEDTQRQQNPNLQNRRPSNRRPSKLLFDPSSRARKEQPLLLLSLTISGVAEFS